MREEESNIHRRHGYSTTLVAILILIVVAVVIISFVLSSLTTETGSSSSTSTTTTGLSRSNTTTSTIITSTTSSTGGLSGSGATILSKAWGPWNYTVSLNTTNVNAGERILFWGNLTYTEQNITKVYLAGPSVNIRVLDAAGKTVWEYVAAGSVAARNFYKGEEVSFYFPVPTSGFKPGTYSIDSEPRISSYPDNQELGGNMQIKANFTVASSLSSTTTTTATTAQPTTSVSPLKTDVRQNDFLFQISVDKSTYQYGEPVVIYYNLTFIGELSRSVHLPYNPFSIDVYNATHSLAEGLTTTAGMRLYKFTPGMSITSRATVNGGIVEVGGAGGNIISFSPNSTYSIQGTVDFYEATSSGSVGAGIRLTAPPLQILITKEV